MAATTITAPSLRRDVQVTSAPAATARTEPSLAHYLVIGVVVTTIALAVGVTLPIWIAYGSFWSAAGVGGLAAMWGGPCFGLIAGAATFTFAHRPLTAHRSTAAGSGDVARPRDDGRPQPNSSATCRQLTRWSMNAST
jgi:hypothetical protein